MRPVAPLLCSIALLGCWQPPELPPDDPPPVAPGEAELLGARPYTVTPPTNYSTASQWPLLVVLHDYGSSGPATVSWLGLTALANARGFFVVAPEGVLDSKQKRAWHPSSVHAAPWDVEYLLAVIHDLKAKYRIDPKRVYVLGYSQGANMAHRMGCDAAAEVVGLVSIAGQAQACHPAQPVSVVALHGTGDEIVGYYGDALNPSNPSFPTAHDTIGLWGLRDGCQAIAASAQTLDLVVDVDGSETTIETFSGCPSSVAVELWTMTDTPHLPVWAQGAAAHLYDFLDAHARP